MAYEPKITSGGWPYLGGAGTFAQLVAGFKWIAETHENLSREFLRVKPVLGLADLNTIDRGVYRQPYDANATPARNYPDGAKGGLLVAVNGDPDNEIRQIYFSDEGVWHRVRRAFTWLPWSQLSSDFRVRGLLGATDLNTVVQTGIHIQRWSANTTTARNYPAQGLGEGVLRVFPVGVGAQSTTRVRQEWSVTAPWPGSSWHRVLTDGVWSAWAPLGGDPNGSTKADLTAPGTPGASATRRATRLSTARKRLLGGHGTAGQGAVALRFDDGHAEFKAKVLPLLRKHGLPAYIAVTDRLLTESGVAYSEVQTWAINSGVEVTSHSRDHVDKTSEADILSAIHTFGDDLEKSVGQIVVDTWTFPGGGDFGGVNAGTYPSLYADTYAGRLILERYAVPNGGSAGYLQPLDGTPTVGQSHVTIEAYTLAQVQDMVRKAQARGMGVSLMMHPTRLDTTGYMSTATLDAAMAWLAEERDLGRLAVLTGTGLGFADASSTEGVNMLRNGFFEGASDWSFEGNWGIEAGVRAYTASGTTFKQSVVINEFAAARGAPVTLSVDVQAAAGDVAELRLYSTGALSATRRVTLKAGWQRVVLPATIPTGTALGSSLDAAIQRVSSAGAVSFRNARLNTI